MNKTEYTKAVAANERLGKAYIMFLSEISRWGTYDACNPVFRALEETRACFDLTEKETFILAERYHR